MALASPSYLAQLRQRPLLRRGRRQVGLGHPVVQFGGRFRQRPLRLVLGFQRRPGRMPSSPMLPVTDRAEMRPEKISRSALTMSHCMVAAMIRLP